MKGKFGSYKDPHVEVNGFGRELVCDSRIGI